MAVFTALYARSRPAAIMFLISERTDQNGVPSCFSISGTFYTSAAYTTLFPQGPLQEQAALLCSSYCPPRDFLFSIHHDFEFVKSYGFLFVNGSYFELMRSEL